MINVLSGSSVSPIERQNLMDARALVVCRTNKRFSSSYIPGLHVFHVTTMTEDVIVGSRAPEFTLVDMEMRARRFLIKNTTNVFARSKT